MNDEKIITGISEQDQYYFVIPDELSHDLKKKISKLIFDHDKLKNKIIISSYGRTFSFFKLVNGQINNNDSITTTVYQDGCNFLVANCRNPEKNDYRAIKNSNEYSQEAIKKGTKAYIPNTLQPISYVNQFNTLAESKKMSKAETIRFLIDYFYSQ